MDNSNCQQCESNAQWMNFPESQRYNNSEYWDDIFTQIYQKIHQPNKALLFKEIVYKGANLLAFVTVVILIIAGIYNVYQGFSKSLVVHPINFQKRKK